MSEPIDVCRSCRKPLGRHRPRKHIPVEPEPDSGGNIMLQKIGTTLHAGVLSGSRLAAAQSNGAVLHLAHFVSCTHANTWRKR